MFYYIVGTFVFVSLLYIYFAVIKPRGSPLYKAKKEESVGNFKRAISLYEEYLTLHPNDYEVHYKLYELYLKVGNEEKAFNHIDEVIRIGRFPQSLSEDDVYKKAYILSKKLGFYDKAFFYLYKAYKKYPLDTFLLREIGFIALGQREFEIAIRFLGEYERLVKDDTKAYLGLAICYAELGKIDEAEKFFDKAISLDPQNDNLMLLAGLFFYFNKIYPKAIASLNKVIEKDIEPYIVFFSRRLKGYAYLYLDDVNKALDTFEENLKYVGERELKGEEPSANFDMAIGNIFLDNMEEVDKYLRIGKMISPIIFQELRELLSDKDFSIEKFEMKMKLYRIIDKLFPRSLLYKLSGFSSEYQINIEELIEAIDEIGKIDEEIMKSVEEALDKAPVSDKVSALKRMTRKELVYVVRRLIDTMGYIPVKELGYKERDGVDFLIHTKSDLQDRGILQFRNWHNVEVGEVVINNLYSAIGEEKLSYGILVVPTTLTKGAKNLVAKYKNKISIVERQKLNELLVSIRF